MNDIFSSANWLTVPAALILGPAAALLLLFLLKKRLLRRFEALRLFPDLLKKIRTPVLAFLPVFFLRLMLPALKLPPAAGEIVEPLLNIWLILALAFGAVRGTGLVREAVLSRYRLDEKDNLKARAVYTQIRVIERIVIFAVIVIAIAAVLMSFDRVRQLGVSILASAGVIGLVVGLAAQKTIGSVLAGLQIAITQPIRIDDVLIVEGEWGKVEEITLTYVVVAIWDQRRLVVPITYFLEKPFQNWTRRTSEILGTVFIHTDYTVPVEAIRRELIRILEATELWDRRVAGLVVTEAGERTVLLRGLMSAPDSGTAWDLRCLVREKLLEYFQKNYPDSLPRYRVELPGREGGAAGLKESETSG
jgi:small-conductance mechanosensitive channel